METKDFFPRRHESNAKMKLLICGDIHGNLPALEKMLFEETNNFEKFICHGDVVNYGPWSNECVDLLETLPNKILLRGNHEEYFLDGNYPGVNIVAKTFFEFCYPLFSNFDKIALYEQSFIAGDFEVIHSINHQYFFYNSIINRIDKSYIIGHSHQQFQRIIGDYLLINTGSVGQNRSNISLINYLIYDLESQVIELKNIKYDPSCIINEMVSRSYPEICINYYKNKIS